MNAPYAGFLPKNGLSVTNPRYVAWLKYVAPRMSNKYAGDLVASAYCWNGVASSRIQMLRPCVARIMSLSRGWNPISWIGTVGRFPLKRVHGPPRFGVPKN